MFLNSAQNCKCKYTTNNNADNDDARFFLAKSRTEELSNGRAVEQKASQSVRLQACKPHKKVQKKIFTFSLWKSKKAYICNRFFIKYRYGKYKESSSTYIWW